MRELNGGAGAGAPHGRLEDIDRRPALRDDHRMGDLGSRLRSHRQRLGLSLTAASEQAGIPRLRLDLIERGTLPPPSVVPRLVAGLNISGQLADDLALASSDWRRPQPEDWGGGTCVVVTTNHMTGRE